MFEFLKPKKKTTPTTQTAAPTIEDVVFTARTIPVATEEAPESVTTAASSAPESIDGLTVTMSHDPDEEAEEDAAMIPSTGDIQVFRHERFGEMRVVNRDGEPWFVAADVCRALDIGNPTQACSRLDEDEKITTLISNESAATGKNMAVVISEPGLYSLALGSRKPEAKAFKRWVTHEVIPAIRKHGAYMTATTIDSIIADPASFVKLAQALADEREKTTALSIQNAKLVEVNGHLEWENDGLSQKIEADAPKVRFAESFRDADGCVSIAELAKLLCERGYQTGEKRLFETLRHEGFLCKSGHDRNHPAQRYLEMAKPIFALRASIWEGEDGQTHQYTKTMVTPAGITYFFKHFLGDAFRLPAEEKKDRAESSRESAAKAREVLNEKVDRCEEVIRRILEQHMEDERKLVTIEEISESIPELSEYNKIVIGRALNQVGVFVVRNRKERRYPMPESLFEKAEPVKSTHNARTQLVRVIIAGEKSKGTGMTLMTADQFLAMHRDKLGDMSVANLEAALRACGVESDTSYGTLLWKLPA